jgi:hypothetical protein
LKIFIFYDRLQSGVEKPLSTYVDWKIALVSVDWKHFTDTCLRAGWTLKDEVTPGQEVLLAGIIQAGLSGEVETEGLLLLFKKWPTLSPRLVPEPAEYARQMAKAISTIMTVHQLTKIGNPKWKWPDEHESWQQEITLV